MAFYLVTMVGFGLFCRSGLDLKVWVFDGFDWLGYWNGWLNVLECLMNQ